MASRLRKSPGTAARPLRSCRALAHRQDGARRLGEPSGRRGRPEGRQAIRSIRSAEEALLPGTSDRAFRIGLVVVSLSVVSALATYLILSALTPIRPANEVVLSVLMVNAAARGRHGGGDRRPGCRAVARLEGQGRRRRLHVRIVALFSLIAALPALLLTLAATSTFSRALDSWFDEQTTAIVQNAADVGKAYLLEHGQVIRTDIVNMARDLDEAAPPVGGDIRKFRDLMVGAGGLRDLPLAYIDRLPPAP